MGAWSHIPALLIASELSGDVYTVSFSLLGPPLIVASVVLSWRYVVKYTAISTARAEGGQVQ